MKNFFFFFNKVTLKKTYKIITLIISKIKKDVIYICLKKIINKKDKYFYCSLKKGNLIENYSNKDINDIANWMNNYPRKIFGYKTSFEMLRQEIKDDNLFNKLFANRTFFLINKKELK